jgi:hypothetical protein
MQTQEASKDKVLIILLHAVFFLSGVATVLIGQVLPFIAARQTVPDETRIKRSGAACAVWLVTFRTNSTRPTTSASLKT